MPEFRLSCRLLSSLLIPSLLSAQTDAGKPGVCAIPIPVARQVRGVEMLKPATPKLERDLLNRGGHFTNDDRAAIAALSTDQHVVEMQQIIPMVFIEMATAFRDPRLPAKTE